MLAVSLKNGPVGGLAVIGTVGSGMFILAGLGIRLWCTVYVGGRKSRELITDGPYSLCRNPLYVGSILAATGIGFQTEMITFGFICGVLCWAVFRIVVGREETFLLFAFGQPYQDYCRTTPRFWPRSWSYKDDLHQHVFRPAMLWNTFRDGLVLFVAIPVTEAIEAAHRAGALNALFRFY